MQTFNPEAPAIASVVGHDSARFAEGELKLRPSFLCPPLCRLVEVRIDSAHPDETAQAPRAARAASLAVRAGKDRLRLFGPGPGAHLEDPRPHRGGRS